MDVSPRDARDADLHPMTIASSIRGMTAIFERIATILLKEEGPTLRRIGPSEQQFFPSLDGSDVLSLQTLRPLAGLELDLLPLGQGAEAIRLNRRMMAEHIVAATILGNEPIALRIVKPLHCTSSHFTTSFMF